MVRAGGTLKAGDLRHRLRIEERNDTEDDFGEPIPSWSEVATVWGILEPLTGREREGGEGLDSTVDHRARIRDLAGLTADMRILWDSRTFEIKHIMRDPVRSSVEMLVTEQVDNPPTDE